MGENHLTYFKIENFKRFDSFEMENLGQFNLLVGDNNVGKTSVLEGLLFDSPKNDIVRHIATFVYILFKRKLILLEPSGKFTPSSLEESNIFDSLIHNINNTLSFKHTFSNGIERIIKLTFLNNRNIETNEGFRDELLKYRIEYQKDNNNSTLERGQYFNAVIPYFMSPSSEYYFPIINFDSGYNEDLLFFYYEQINADKEQRLEFTQNLSQIIPNLAEIRTHKSSNKEFLAVELNNKKGLFPISQFGDGVVKVTRILLEILMARGNRLMIDEIETGIHFSRLKDFWKTVITLCKQFDVQLFATTHSLECQRYFVEALSELGDEYQKDARNISLLENAKGEVKSVTFDFEQFEFALSIGANTRGGQR